MCQVPWSIVPASLINSRGIKLLSMDYWIQNYIQKEAILEPGLRRPQWSSALSHSGNLMYLNDIRSLFSAPHMTTNQTLHLHPFVLTLVVWILTKQDFRVFPLSSPISLHFTDSCPTLESQLWFTPTTRRISNYGDQKRLVQGAGHDPESLSITSSPYCSENVDYK